MLRERFAAVRVWGPAALGLAVGGLVVAPLWGRGWLLLVDWSSGPTPSLPREYWGLDGGLLYGLFPAMALGVGRVVGHAAAPWVLVWASLAVAGAGMGRLVGGGAVRRGSAALLYCVNPFVFERLSAGQLNMAAGYALLPYLARAAVRRSRWTGVWLGVMAAVLTHFVWLGAVVVAAAVLWERRRRAVLWAVGVAGVTGALTAFLWLPLLWSGVPVDLDDRQLRAFATYGDPDLGVLGNVVGLYGFFRPGPSIPKQDVGGWLFFLVAVLAVVAVGAWRAWRAGPGPQGRGLLGPLGVAAAVGLVLALGTWGPTGGVFRWAAYNVPGFAMMREPQKFAALLALAYAVGFGFGVEELVERARGGRLARGATALACAGLVVAYTPTLFFGLNGQWEPVRYPASWEAADRLMGAGEGKVLFLPWHRFLRLTFTERRVFNPADAFFRRPVIAGDNIELAGLETLSSSPQSRFLEELFLRGRSACRAGALLAPLGVEYVVVAKTGSWRTYGWLDAQADLEKASEDRHLVVYRNRAWVSGAGYRTAALPSAGLSSRCEADERLGTPAARRDSPVAYDVSFEGDGGGWVLLAERFDEGWRLGGQRPVQTARGTLAFKAAPGRAEFSGWSRQACGYAISCLALAGVLLVRFRGRVRIRGGSGESRLSSDTSQQKVVEADRTC